MMTPFFSWSLAGDLVGQRLAQRRTYLHGEAFADDGTPATSAECDEVLLLLAAGRKRRFCMMNSARREVGGGVDALDFVRSYRQ